MKVIHINKINYLYILSSSSYATGTRNTNWINKSWLPSNAILNDIRNFSSLRKATTNASWIPIGKTNAMKFFAIFKDNVFRISNLYANRFDAISGAVGLFGSTKTDSTCDTETLLLDHNQENHQKKT